LQEQNPQLHGEEQLIGSDEQKKNDVTVEKLQKDLRSVKDQLSLLIPNTDVENTEDERQSLTVSEEIFHQVRLLFSCYCTTDE